MADRILWSRMRSADAGRDLAGGIRSFRGGGLSGQSLRSDERVSTSSKKSGRSGSNARKAKNATAGTARKSERVDNGGSRRIRIMRKLIFGLIVAAVAVVAAEITFQSVLAPNLAIRQVRLRGDAVISESRLLDVAGLSGTILYFHVDSDAIAARLEAIPEVSDAVVETDFPDTLTIELTARNPLAVTHVNEDGRSVPAVIDREGVVFRKGLRSSEYDLPVISGLRLERFDAGDTLPEELRQLFEDLARLRMDEPTLFAAVSEIRIVRRAGEYETVMYPTFAPVSVRMPARVEVDRYDSAVHAIEALERRGELGSIGQIDMRSGDVVYTTNAEE